MEEIELYGAGERWDREEKEAQKATLTRGGKTILSKWPNGPQSSLALAWELLVIHRLTVNSPLRGGYYNTYLT